MMSSYSVFSPIKSFCVNWLQERFVVTAFISHSLDGKLRQQFKALSLRIRFATHTKKEENKWICQTLQEFWLLVASPLS